MVRRVYCSGKSVQFSTLVGDRKVKRNHARKFLGNYCTLVLGCFTVINKFNFLVAAKGTSGNFKVANHHLKVRISTKSVKKTEN